MCRSDHHQSLDQAQYGSPESPAHYHLIIDSTAISLDEVVELIVQASEARRRHAVSSTVA